MHTLNLFLSISYSIRPIYYSLTKSRFFSICLCLCVYVFVCANQLPHPAPRPQIPRHSSLLKVTQIKVYRKQTNKSQSTIAAAGDVRMDISYFRCMFAISNPKNQTKIHKSILLYLSICLCVCVYLGDNCDRFSLSRIVWYCGGSCSFIVCVFGY